MLKQVQHDYIQIVSFLFLKHYPYLYSVMSKITVAIDGYSSCGKSTLAKQLAKHLGYIYVDTGAMYRAVAFYAMQNDIINSLKFNKESLINDLPQIN